MTPAWIDELGSLQREKEAIFDKHRGGVLPLFGAVMHRIGVIERRQGAICSLNARKILDSIAETK